MEEDKSKKRNIWGRITGCCCNETGETGTYHGPGGGTATEDIK